MAQFVSKGYIDLDGVTVLKSATLSLDMQDGNADVDTVLDGFSGHTVGSAKYMIKIDGPIPAAGMEVAKEFNLEGDFRTPSANLGVNKVSDAGVTFHGRDLE